MAETKVETPKNKRKAKPNAPEPDPEPAKQGRAKKKDEIPRAVSFFERVEKIAKEDWGTRAKIKVYRLKPIADYVRVTGQKFAHIYEEPVNEEKLKQDEGSGRYRLYLNFKQPAEGDKEIDSIELDILDPRYPPNLPKGAWVDDPRNKEWEWAKPLLEKKWAAQEGQPTPQPQQQMNAMAETFRAVKEIMPQPTTVKDTIETIGAVKALIPQPPPPTENALLNSIVQLVVAQNTASQVALAAAQERGDKLLAQVIALSQRPPQEQPNGLATFKGVLGELKDLVGVDTIKDLFSRGTEAVTGRSRMSGWQEFLQPMATKLMDGIGPIASAIMNLQIQKMQMQRQQQTQNGTAQTGQVQQQIAAPVNGTQQPVNANGATAQPQQPPAANLINFLDMVEPSLENHFKEWVESGEEEWSGDGFATWVYDGYGQLWRGIDWHAEAKKLGALMLVTMYKQSPYWKAFEAHEAKFNEFVQSFCEWSAEPPPEEEPGKQIHADVEEPEGVEVL